METCKDVTRLNTSVKKLHEAARDAMLTMRKCAWTAIGQCIPANTKVKVMATTSTTMPTRLEGYLIQIGEPKSAAALDPVMSSAGESFVIRIAVDSLQDAMNHWYEVNNLDTEIEHTFDPSLGEEGRFFFRPRAAPTIIENSNGFELYFPFEVRVDWPIDKGIGYGGSHANVTLVQGEEFLGLFLPLDVDLVLTSEGWGTWKEFVQPQAAKRAELFLRELVPTTIDVAALVPEEFHRQFKEEKMVIESFAIDGGFLSLYLGQSPIS